MDYENEEKGQNHEGIDQELVKIIKEKDYAPDSKEKFEKVVKKEVDKSD